jgi:hypothetical protein
MLVRVRVCCSLRRLGCRLGRNVVLQVDVDSIDEALLNMPRKQLYDTEKQPHARILRAQ